MNKDTKTKIVAFTLTILLTLSLIFAFDKMSTNKRLKAEVEKGNNKLDEAKLEKAGLVKEIENFKNQILTFEGKNKSLDEFLTSLKAQVEEKEKQLAKANRQAKDANFYKNEMASLKKLNEELNKKLSQLTSENMSLVAELSTAKTTIAGLNDKIENYSKARTNVLNTDNYRMDALRKRGNKLTVKAPKMKKLEVSFDALAYGSSTNYQLMVKEQSGRPMAGTVALNFKENEPTLYASNESIGAERLKRRIELEFVPDQKLKPGIYSILVYHDQLEVGMAQIRLSK